MKPELPPLLAPGMHDLSLEQIRLTCLEGFPTSTTRQAIMEGLEEVVARLSAANVPAELWIDGSFLTQEVNPSDVDFLVCVDAEVYNNGTPEQQAALRWVDGEDLREPLRCDCHLSTLAAPGEFWHSHDLDHREYMRRLFGTSRGGDAKGIAVLQVGSQP